MGSDVRDDGGVGVDGVLRLSDIRIRVDLVREVTDLRSLLTERLREPKRGRFQCPFHKDKHPDLSVKGEKWNCFACGEHGDAIDFIRLLDGLTFMDALKVLEARAGIPGAAIGENTRRAMERARAERAVAQEEREKRRRYFLGLANRRDQIKVEIKRQKPAVLQGSPTAAKYLAGAYDAINRLEAEMDAIMGRGEL